MHDVYLNLHDRLCLKLSHATPADIRNVKRLVGGIDAPANSDGHLHLQFMAPTRFNATWRNLDRNYAYTTDGRILYTYKRTPIEVRLPQTLENPDCPRLTYAPGSRRFPLLRSILNVVAAEHQIVGVHGTAFTLQDQGFLVCGWPGGGKTGMLLTFLLHGAEYLSAEWAYISDEGSLLHGTPETIRLRDWHVRNSKGRLGAVRLRDQIRLSGIRCIESAVSGLSRSINWTRTRQSEWLNELSAKLRKRAFVDRPAEDLLGHPVHRRAAPIHTILFVGTHRSPTIQVEQLETGEAKRRLRALQEGDLDDFVQLCGRWDYAFADTSCWLADYRNRSEALLESLVHNKACYSIAHPSDVDLDCLFHETYRVARN